MKVILYDKVEEFLNANEDILLKKEAANQLILFNGYATRDKEVSKDILFGRVEENGETCLIFCNVSPYNLLIQNFRKDFEDSIDALVYYLIENKVEIRGINANKKVCDKFIENYEDKTGCKFKEKLAMDIMELRNLNDITLSKGYFREAIDKELDILLDWHIKFAKEALNEDIAAEKFVDNVKIRINNRVVYIFEDEKHIPVSMAMCAKQLRNGISVNLVYSDKNKRGNGYGMAVVYYLSKLYLERGNKFCSLFVDKHNPISNGVYAKIGYKIIEDNFEYRIV